MYQPQGPAVGVAHVNQLPSGTPVYLLQPVSGETALPAQQQNVGYPQPQAVTQHQAMPASPPRHGVSRPAAAAFRLVVVDHRFVTQVPVNLRMRENALSWSGDDFVIQDATTRQPWFRIDGKVMSLKSKKYLVDVANVPVAVLDHDTISLRGTMSVYTPQGRSLFKVKPQLRLLEKEMVAEVRNLSDGSVVKVYAKGNWLGKKCSLMLGDPKHGGIEIARVSKTRTAKSFFLGADDYVLTVHPGVDVAFCVLMTLAFDERYHDKRND